MAIYSFGVGRVGRTTHRAGTAGAHASYVIRSRSASIVLGEHMPTGKRSASTWLNRQETNDRKNARVIEKIRVCFPTELTEAQRRALLLSYVQKIGKGRIPWLAGIHDLGSAAHNPHAHILIRDRDIETGRRVAKLSEKGSCDWLRKLWEEEANFALAEAGYAVRIDCRSLRDQGIDRQPQRHQGIDRQPQRHQGPKRRSRKPSHPSPFSFPTAHPA